MIGAHWLGEAAAVSRMMTDHAPLAILCACLALEDVGDDVIVATLERAATHWHAVCWLAGNHLVTPTLAGALQRKGLFDRLPDEVREYLATLQALNRDRNRMLREQLFAITGQLNRLGIQPLLLKGAIALLPDAYPGAEDRVMGDLDILVPEARLPEAIAAVTAMGYRHWDEGVLLPGESETWHHFPALLHSDLPVKLELHRRIVDDPADDARLRAGLESRIVTMPGAGEARAPDIPTRLLHNFLHAQIVDRHRRRRELNLRQLYEFAALAQAGAGKLCWPELLARLRPRYHAALAEYLAQAEGWLGLTYPEAIPRSPHAERELWLIRQAQTRANWRRLFAAVDYLRRLPPRVARLPLRLVLTPAWLPAKLKSLRKNRDA